MCSHEFTKILILQNNTAEQKVSVLALFFSSLDTLIYFLPRNTTSQRICQHLADQIFGGNYAVFQFFGFDERQFFSRSRPIFT